VCPTNPLLLLRRPWVPERVAPKKYAAFVNLVLTQSLVKGSICRQRGKFLFFSLPSCGGFIRLPRFFPLFLIFPSKKTWRLKGPVFPCQVFVSHSFTPNDKTQLDSFQVVGYLSLGPHRMGFCSYTREGLVRNFCEHPIFLSTLLSY